MEKPEQNNSTMTGHDLRLKRDVNTYSPSIYLLDIVLSVSIIIVLSDPQINNLD